jgi:peptidoglycan/xylan/chitin deacetylase (PgdA/CDA1 family)
LPNDAKVALWVIPNVEYFPFDLPSTPINPACAHLVPDVLNFSWRDYGTRVGIWRIMDILDEAGIRATSATNALVCDYFPEYIEEAKRRGWEFMCHGLTNARGMGGMNEKDERETIFQSVEKLTRSTGKAPQGWLGPALAETMRTPDILKEAGLEYVSDWVNDDQPYYMNTLRGPLVSMPYTIELNDIQVFLRGGYTPEQYYRMLIDQFEVLYEEGARSARVMGISLHPFIAGVAYRSKYLRKALLEITASSGVWLATGGEIVSWFKQAASPEEVAV